MTDLFQRKSLSLPDGNLSYLAGPYTAGRPNLNFIHATGFNANTYISVLEPLTRYVNIYAPDLRGHGLGTLHNDPGLLGGNWEIYRQDFYRFLDFINEPIYLVGHSVGAAISLAGAVHRQDLLRGILLIEASLPAVGRSAENPFKITTLPEAARKRRKHFPSRQVAIKNYFGKGAFQTWQTRAISDYINGGTITLDDGSVELSCNPEWEATSFEAAERNPWPVIRKVTCPIMLIHGNRNSTCEPSGVEYFKKIQPSAQIIQISNASHFLPLEKPDLVVKAALSLITDKPYNERVMSRNENTN